MASTSTHRLLNVFLAIVLLLFNNILNAQQIIRGKIIQSESGKPLPGATVTVKATGRSQVTDANGEFSVDATREDQLEVSYVGNTTTTISAANAALIQLSNDAKNLNEVVVTDWAYEKK